MVKSSKREMRVERLKEWEEERRKRANFIRSHSYSVMKNSTCNPQELTHKETHIHRIRKRQTCTPILHTSSSSKVTGKRWLNLPDVQVVLMYWSWNLQPLTFSLHFVLVNLCVVAIQQTLFILYRGSRGWHTHLRALKPGPPGLGFDTSCNQSWTYLDSPHKDVSHFIYFLKKLKEPKSFIFITFLLC